VPKPRLASTLGETSSRDVRATWIFCPWLKRSPRESDIWTSILAVHDINGTLRTALSGANGPSSDVYAGILALDVLQSTKELIRDIQSAGVGGVINFPSVSFIDGEAAAAFAHLSLGIDRELDCLAACAKQGLRIAGVVRSVQAAQRLLELGAQFLVAHAGPPVPGYCTDEDSTAAIMEMAARRHTPVFLLSDLTR
jgi:predicted TIM-barrel enzyme